MSIVATSIVAFEPEVGGRVELYRGNYTDYLDEHGKPVALYSDKVGVFRINKPQPSGGAGQTQFGRALSVPNIDIICANAPAAKGRVERAHLTLQGRLVKEIRLRGISDIESANELDIERLAPEVIPVAAAMASTP